MRRFAGIVLLIIGAGLFIGGGLCSVILDFRLLRAAHGFWVAIGATIVFPLIAAFGPLYAGLVYGFWEPLWLMMLSAIGLGLLGLGVILRGAPRSRRVPGAAALPPPESPG